MVEFIITGKPQREERFDYPLEAIREIVVNMIVHRDYRDSSDSVIKIFNNKIEFYNPGKLFGDLTIDDLLSNNYSSKIRNKLIAAMFKETGIIEKYGSGIRRIMNIFKSSGIIKPKFEEFQNGFKVTLFKEKISEGVNEGVSEGVNNKIDLLNYIIANPGLRTNHLSEKTKVPQKTIERWLRELKTEKKAVYRGSPKTGGYYAK
ncbi:MAG: hypothetical protein KAX05_07745 [Bacteroidales bacterium]|nr:hypothetical protein [Bacteroidales bacterium]